MKEQIVCYVWLLVMTAAGPAPAADIERTEDIARTLRFRDTGVDRLVIVDNVWGAIKVRGTGSEEVTLNVRKTIFARSQSKLEEAEEGVELEIYEEDDVIELYVDGPFRDVRGRGIDWRGYRREGYKVEFDFELEVPEGCSVELRTVDDGDIVVESCKGDFDVSNVNGRIEMTGLAGSGEVYAVNGKVLLEFDENPRGNCSIGTVNGDVRLYFQPQLSADFYLKTMNGEAYTDFEVSSLPGRTTASNEHNGKSVYRVARMSGIRAGTGGPEIELHTLNGDMFILSK